LDQYVLAPSPIGDVYVAFGTSGVTCVDRASAVSRFEESYFERFGRPVRRAKSLPKLIARIIERGSDPSEPNGLTCDLSALSDFDRRVLEATMRIPRGETRSYAQIAADVGSPRAHRAVGTALSHNPVPLLIPCHRVIRSDGTVGEYGLAGPEAKRRLLDLDARLSG
jgi:methylated-DNA-[protein]-cysteine S-methyltransferase